MRSHQRYLTFLGLCLVVLVPAVVLSEGDETWRSLYEQVTASAPAGSKIGSLRPKKTLQLLEQLVGIIPAANREELEKVEQLHSFSFVDEDRCQRGVFTVYDKKLAAEGKSRKSITRYLEHYKDEQYKVCKSLLSKRLAEQGAQLNESDAHDLDMLMDMVADRMGLVGFSYRLDVPSEYLAEVVHTFLDKKEGPLGDKIGNAEQLKEMFNNSVVAVCQRVSDQLKAALGVFDSFNDDFNLILPVGSETYKLLKGGKICQQLMSPTCQKEVADFLYEEFKNAN